MLFDGGDAEAREARPRAFVAVGLALVLDGAGEADQVDQCRTDDADEAGLRQEYVSSRWIEVVRPDFKQVTAAVWADVTQMIRENREAILAASLEE